ncbi:DegT/DnrJ/EryC1/StrS family aminotransferase [Candidatus Pantoea formicae]|jgi:dTDP-4-amino-4,6-dideoxygalactose transaminase|uniref:DegT/DnrJ/EryC1/StrS family aminotransferase n=1 Tax=Candidatus Pantoea formicae TaxID=2608355 RepID=UPI003ED9A57F
MKKIGDNPHYDRENVLVTSPLLPPLEEFIPYLEEIWQSKRLTNGGPFHQQLEKELADYLGVQHLSLFANGTLALMTAMQALRITGEVITTPYSFVATSHSLMWNGLTPVFADVDPANYNLTPEAIERAITPRTTAIMPVHCYGVPCDVERIQEIADTYGLKVIYDAAHAFGVKLNGESILNFGDMSVLSFHATKVFNTIEGGAIICPDAKTKKRIDYLKNFGFANETTVVATGINGKLNEVQAAFGLLQLKHIDVALEQRRELTTHYMKRLGKLEGIQTLIIPDEVEWNYSYFPILINEELMAKRDDIYHALQKNGIMGRRYFYPLISQFAMYKEFASAAPSNLPVAQYLSSNVICLPLYPGLSSSEVNKIVDIIESFSRDITAVNESSSLGMTG